MKAWIFKKFSDMLEAAITMRIVMFHDAMIKRGQIPPPQMEGPQAQDLPGSSI